VKLEDLSSNFQEALIASLSERDEISELLKQKELREKLHKAIDSLPECYKPVFILRDIDGLSTEEVAEILKITVPAVKSRLHRSRLILRKKLANFYGEYRVLKEVQGRPIASNC
jgi:RNA polymerase sigma-70 factor (ECF subfamily)